jgi:hypothetical protein
VHAEAGDALLRGAEELPTVRPRPGMREDRLTTRHLVSSRQPRERPHTRGRQTGCDPARHIRGTAIATWTD